MLKEIEDIEKRKNAQDEFRRLIRSKMIYKGEVPIGYQGATRMKELYLSRDQNHWASIADRLDDRPIQKYWNAFGKFNNRASVQNIAVEINIPEHANANVAGFFATDQTGVVKLMHDGSIGGGKPGVGRSSFLNSTDFSLSEVSRIGRPNRHGICVADLNDPHLLDKLWIFVEKVYSFKSTV